MFVALRRPRHRLVLGTSGSENLAFRANYPPEEKLSSPSGFASGKEAASPWLQANFKGYVCLGRIPTPCHTPWTAVSDGRSKLPGTAASLDYTSPGKRQTKIRVPRAKDAAPQKGERTCKNCDKELAGAIAIAHGKAPCGRASDPEASTRHNSEPHPLCTLPMAPEARRTRSLAKILRTTPLFCGAGHRPAPVPLSRLPLDLPRRRAA